MTAEKRNWMNAESAGSRLNPPSQEGLPPDQYRTLLGTIINLFHIEEVQAELDRLRAWSDRWLRLAKDYDRMRKMGGLQSQQDYILGRSIRASKARQLLISALRSGTTIIQSKTMDEILAEHKAELKAWRTRFPQYKYRKQDDCVTLK